MGASCQNDTETCQFPSRGWLALTIALPLALGLGAGVAQAQDGEEDQAIDLVCSDDTKLNVLFDEQGAVATLADGTKLTLPFKGEDPFVIYSNGKFTLNDKGDVLEWVVGKKAAVECQPDEADMPTQFDQPVAVDNLDLPKDKANPDARPAINCYRYPGFMVKEVDLGEVGAEKLGLMPQDGKCVRDDAAEKPIKDEISGYFLGVKGPYVFFQAADGINGAMPFTVYDSKTATKLFEDSFAGADFDAIDIDGANMTLTFQRSYSADCSLYLDAKTCAETIKKATGLGTIAPLPECGAAYDEAKKQTPDYAKEIEQIPSVITYNAKLTFDGKAATVVPLAGETACGIPD